jgi:hyperosmotically inducible protein
MTTKWILAVALVAGIFAAPLAASAQVTDTELANKVASTVRKYPHFTIFDDVTITVKDRAVTLTGRVTEQMKHDELGARIAKVDGVRQVVNNIGVLPSSPLDSELRQRIAKAIYGNPSFVRYTSMTVPPIHIVVENGHVTLTGYVNDEGEKALAFALAHVNGAFDVKNELKIDRN